jgi:hypothetical protein
MLLFRKHRETVTQVSGKAQQSALVPVVGRRTMPRPAGVWTRKRRSRGVTTAWIIIAWLGMRRPVNRDALSHLLA